MTLTQQAEEARIQKGLANGTIMPPSSGSIMDDWNRLAGPYVPSNKIRNYPHIPDQPADYDPNAPIDVNPNDVGQYAYGGYLPMAQDGNNPFGTGMDYGIPSGPTFQESDIPSINWKHKEKRMGNPYAKQIAAGVIGTENFLTNLMPNLNGETKDANDKFRDSLMASNIYSTNTNSLKGAWSPEGYFQANRQDNGWMGNTFPGRALGGDYNPNEEYDLTPEEIVEIYRRGGTVKFC